MPLSGKGIKAAEFPVILLGYQTLAPLNLFKNASCTMTGSIVAASFFTIKFGGKPLKELLNLSKTINFNHL